MTERVRARLRAIERAAGLDKPRARVVLTDNHGHRLTPQGEPKQGDRVTVIHIGGIDIDKDL